MRRLGVILAWILVTGVVLVVIGAVGFIAVSTRAYVVTENLVFAAGDADHDAIRASLRAGAKVNGRTDGGRTALEMAFGHPDNPPERTRETLRLLFRAGADPNLPASDGRLPIELTDDPALLRLLKSYGARYGPKLPR